MKLEKLTLYCWRGGVIILELNMYLKTSLLQNRYQFSPKVQDSDIIQTFKICRLVVFIIDVDYVSEHNPKI